MRAHTHLTKRASHFALVLCVGLLVSPADAQAAGELTIDLIDHRLSVMGDAGADDQNETLRAYTEARGFLVQAESQTKDAATFTEARTTAPAQEAEIQARLDAFDEDSDPLAELSGLSDVELQARLPLARAELSEASTRIDTLDRRLAARETNAATIRARLTEIAQRIDALPGENLSPDPQAPPSLPEARQWRDGAERIALNAEQRALEARLVAQPARFSAMAAKRAELLLTTTRLSAIVRELESRAGDDQTAILDPEKLGIGPDNVAYPVMLELTTTDAALRQDLAAANKRLTRVRSRIDVISNRTRALEDRFATAQRVVNSAADSDELGRVLLAYWQEIDSYAVEDPTNRLSGTVSSTVIRRIEHEETLAQLVSATGFVNRKLRDAGIEPNAVNDATRSTLLELVGNYRDRLRTIVATDSEYIDAVAALEADYTSLTQLTSKYRGYLEGLILWIPNHPPLWEVDVGSMSSEIAATVRAFADLEVSFGWVLVFGLAAFALLLYTRPRVAAYQIELNDLIARPRDDSIRHTLLALGCVAARALPVPVLVFTAGSLFPDKGPAISSQLADFSDRLAIILFVLGSFRLGCEPSGVARLHFGWQEPTTERTYREIGWLIWWLPVAVVAGIAHQIAPDVGDAVLPRTLLLVATVMLVVHLARNAPWLEAETGERWHQGTLNRGRLVAIGMLTLIALAVVLGLLFSVAVVTAAVIQTVWIGLGVLLLYATLTRWLRVARRNLRMHELLSGHTTELTTVAGKTIEIEEADLGEISAETLQLVNVGTVAVALTALFFTWAPLLPAFDAFGRVTLWTSTTVVDGETIVNQITLATLIVVVLLVGLTLYAARKLPALVELMLRSRTSISQGARYATSTLLNYIIVGAGIITALGALGLQWSQLQWLVAALGVGIGFGLQEIVANFISGLIILFERPIRVGDIVTIGDKDGAVTKIRIRATTLRDWDGKELLVPNKEFITGRLLNWTLSDPQTRLVIPVGIAYGSDVELALRTLMDVISNHPAVLEDPEPSVLFLGFGDSSLNLVARCFVGRMDQRMPTTSELHTKINEAFNAAGIVIAFPQRDLHLDTVGPIRVALEGLAKEP